MAERRTAAAAACLLLAGCLLWAGRKHTAVYQPDETAFPNAQIGYAPGVLDTGPDEPAVTLRYLGLTWRELEPEEGVYAWEAIQQTCHLDALRQQGVHLVLRILCDEPGAEAHLDIPDWLYEKTGNGSWYDLSYGKGYSPDYADPAFFAAHAALLRAVGEWFGADGFVSYVELGSLGHWGEWHVKSGEGLVPLPEEAVRDRYMALYREAFPAAKLLVRRPFRGAAGQGFGLYNDMTGHAGDTAEWLGWIKNGGWYEGDPAGLSPMPDAWQTAPIGGELTSRIPMEQLLETGLDQTLSLVKGSHMSFLGPKTADAAYRTGYDAVGPRLPAAGDGSGVAAGAGRHGADRYPCERGQRPLLLGLAGEPLRGNGGGHHAGNGSAGHHTAGTAAGTDPDGKGQTHRPVRTLLGRAGPAGDHGHRGPHDGPGYRPLRDADGAGKRPRCPLCGGLNTKKPETCEGRSQAFLLPCGSDSGI